MFRGDEAECAKYYICINGHYMQLTCPAPLVWNQVIDFLPTRTDIQEMLHTKTTTIYIANIRITQRFQSTTRRFEKTELFNAIISNETEIFMLILYYYRIIAMIWQSHNAEERLT